LPPLQLQVEFDAPKDNKASVVVFGNSVYNLYNAKHPNTAAWPVNRYSVEPLQFHVHGEEGGCSLPHTRRLQKLEAGCRYNAAAASAAGACCRCRCLAAAAAAAAAAACGADSRRLPALLRQHDSSQPPTLLPLPIPYYCAATSEHLLSGKSGMMELHIVTKLVPT
jgi:hypothetical protein